MKTVLIIIKGLIHLPLGFGRYRTSLRRRHVEKMLRDCGMSRSKSAGWARRCP
jgi:hypothetical protein